MKYFRGRCSRAAPGFSLVWVAGVLALIALALLALAPAFGAAVGSSAL